MSCFVPKYFMCYWIYLAMFLKGDQDAEIMGLLGDIVVVHAPCEHQKYNKICWFYFKWSNFL